MIDRNNVSNILPLTPLQEGMLYREIASGGGAYVMQSRLWIDGHLDTEDFERAWNILADRHEALRTLIAAEGADRPLQVVLKHIHIPVPLHDISNSSESEQKESIEEYCRIQRDNGFDLKNPPLLHLALFRYSPVRHLFVMTFHHIIMDGWCQGILHDELIECLRALTEKRTPNLPAAPSFSGYVRYLAGLDQKEGLDFWRKAMDEYVPGGEISWMKHSASSEDMFDFRRLEFTVCAETITSLRSIAAECGTTLNGAFQTLWGVVTSRLSGKPDVAWGTVVSGRSPDIAGSDHAVGLFINTVPMRFCQGVSGTFRDALRATGDFLRRSLTFQHVPLADVQQACGVYDGLFDHLFIFENYPVSTANNNTGDILAIAPESSLYGHTDYDLVCVADAGDEVQCCLKYNAEAISEENITIIRDTFHALTSAVAADPDKPFKDIEILPENVMRDLLCGLAAGETLTPCRTTFPAMFAAQVKRTPDALAVEAQDGMLTYRELDAASDAIAHALITRADTKPGDRVALMTGHDRTMIPGILGIMKASAVFVPLDPSYPDERVDYILRDCGCLTVVTNKDNADRFGKYDAVTVIEASGIIENTLSVFSPATQPGPDDTAYIIYTSGSTGKPKGVMVPHRALANFIRGYNRSVLNCHENALRIAFVANYVFDAAGRAFYPSLCRGDTVCIVDEETRLDGAALIRFFIQNRIDILDGTPSLCSIALEGGGCDTVRRIVLGGEALTRPIYDRIRTAFPNAAVTNVYGPTETTIDSTFCHLHAPEDNEWNIAPIGKAFPNQRVYVLDSTLRALPPGATGEICIGGEGVAQGYLGLTDLTNEKFLPDPYVPGSMVYRTGDRGRWRYDGNIEFLGRGDSQVKIRGHRIETGEIESSISAIPAVTGCAVVVQSDMDARTVLIAFYSGGIASRKLRDRLKRALPSYMIPNRIIQMDAMPLTPTGKIDRKVLSEYSFGESAPDPEREQAWTETQRLIVEAMNTALGRNDVALHDNFFEVGGHSLTAARLVSLLASKTGKRLPIAALYRFPAPCELAVFVEEYDPALSDHMNEFSFHFNENDRAIYCFPPYGATGIVYRELARTLAEYRLVCFNFIDGIDFVSEAARMILHESVKHPVTFLGYSGGGNLAYETAQEIERGGGTVQHLILIDSHRRLGTAIIPRTIHEREMRDIVSSEEYAIFFPDKASMNTAVRNGAAYAHYLYSGMEHGTVNAPITLISADDTLPDPSRDRFGVMRSRCMWEEQTRVSCTVMKGFGSHDTMLEGNNCAKNGVIVQRILKEVD